VDYDEQQGRVTKLEGGGVMRPQCSACFIVSVKDSLESIDLAKTEGMLFKWGSGTGSNLSALREETPSSPAAGAPAERSNL
jgi:ribonucleoside-diphosphate reductase alpha chain